jgi:hypothetical protein
VVLAFVWCGIGAVNVREEIPKKLVDGDGDVRATLV